MKRVLLLLAGAAATAAMTGCEADRELQLELLAIKNHNREQLLLLKKQSEFLNEKMNIVTEKVESAADNESRLSAELAAYISRPDAVKREILQSLVAQADSLALSQELFLADFEQRLTDRNRTVLDAQLAEIDAMKAALDYQNGFMEYVTTEQDSLNRAFAQRFDSKPWYQSVIGAWEERRETP